VLSIALIDKSADCGIAETASRCDVLPFSVPNPNFSPPAARIKMPTFDRLIQPSFFVVTATKCHALRHETCGYVQQRERRRKRRRDTSSVRLAATFPSTSAHQFQMATLSRTKSPLMLGLKLEGLRTVRSRTYLKFCLPDEVKSDG
jgi:hypothetical protein